MAARHDEGDWHSLKDPSLVFADGRWHLFCTVRGTQRSHAIAYPSFADWAQAAEAHQYVLPFLYQGALDRDRAGKAYGQIPWRLGMLRAQGAR